MSRPNSAFPFLLLIFLSIFSCFCSNVTTAQIDHSSLEQISQALEMPLNASFPTEFVAEDGGDGDIEEINGRRLLHYYQRHYYISYGALSANRIPCPARSGRSYYTHRCHKSNSPVNPYTRGCSSITRCRR
ncbi:hypothetical protein M9H77_25029 [Catharanthus roseus]|uniref:Uncharacterized protein n=1 Tax=Catharanthus roseus TaxID=4058 RepID=A0ACC0A9R5_CATRO|nr:hypothetical protein M9H77_25029 [Catharanthus roseus]